MTNSNASHICKMLFATLTLLFLTGFSAATASSLSLDSSLVAPGDSISGTFDVDDQNTDVQIALDVDQDGQYDSATDTTTTVSSGDINSDTGVTFTSLNVPSGASVGAADVVVIQQGSALSDGDDLSSPDSSTTATIDNQAPTLDSATRNSDTKIDLVVSDNNDVDEGSIVKEDLQLSTGSISSIDVTDSGSNAEVTITLTGPVDASSVDVSLQSNDGIKDVAGNTLSDGDENTVTANNMDGVAPTIETFQFKNSDPTNGGSLTLQVAADEELNTGQISASISGAETGTVSSWSSASGEYTYEATYSASADGDYTATLNTAEDIAGNDGAESEEATVTRDTTAPTIENPSPSDGAIVTDNQATYTVDVTEPTSGVDESSISVTLEDGEGTNHIGASGTGLSTLSWDSSAGTLTINPANGEDSFEMSDGQAQVTVDATDNAGNENTEYSSSFTVDTTPPEITSPEVVITSDQNDNGILNPGDEFEVSAFTVEDETSSVSSVSADLKGLNVQGDSTELKSGDGNSYSKTFTVADGSTDEEISFQVTAEDGQTNPDSADVNGSVSVDNNLPTVSASSATAKVDGEIDVAFSSSTDSAEVDSFNVYRKTSSGEYSSVGTKSSAGTFTDTETTHNTQYTYKVEVVDDAGNAVNSSTVSATADSEAPSIEYGDIKYVTDDSPTPLVGLRTTLGSIDADSIEVTVNDSNTEDGPELDSVTPNSNYVDVISNERVYAADINLKGLTEESSEINLTEGDVNISVTVADSLGNSRTSSKEFTVDTVNPSVTAVKVLDRDRNGRIDAANITFSEAVDDSVITPYTLYFAKGGTEYHGHGSDGQGVEVATGATEDDNKIQIRLSSEKQFPLTTIPDGSGLYHSEAGDVEDLAGNSLPSRTKDPIETIDAADPVIKYSGGTNMVSFPSKVGIYSLDELVSNSGSIESIWRYSNGEWESYKPGRNNGQNDFNMVEGGHGYILEASEDGKIVANVDQGDRDAMSPSGVSIEKGRWNLVGHYEEITEEPLSDVGLDPNTASNNVNQIVEKDGSGSFKSVAEVNPGDGYWVSASADKLYEPSFSDPGF
ncbi:MAG: hypothetical protein H8Z69_05495 [Nanohaloarchaea archaeon]|nr:hypothetical protein [Candidatus Nanohaloarchaea archaeon]